MKEQITNGRLKDKLRVSLGLIKEANEMIERLNKKIDDSKKRYETLQKENMELKSHRVYKFFNWLKSFTR